MPSLSKDPKPILPEKQTAEAKPARIHVNAIPPELRHLSRWCCWQERPSATPGKKPDKPPIQATSDFSGRHVYAKANDPATWTTFEKAERYWREHLQNKGPASGLSFAMNGDGIIGIDLDACRDPNNKTVSGWALKIIQRFGSYTEISPSGTGVRIFLRGRLPVHGRHKGQIEVYDTAKFLTVTGRRIISHGARNGIEDRAAELLAWHREIFGDGATSTKGKIGVLVINGAPDIDQTRLDRLFRSKPKAREIFEGERNGYPSQSEADLALASFAAHAGWTGQAICDLLVMARQNAGEPIKPLDYFTRTIARAGTPHSKNAVSCADGQHAENRTLNQGGAAAHAQHENRTLNKGGAVPKVTTIEQARDVFKRHLYLPDPNVVDVVLSVPAGNKLLETDPLWLFLKGPPGSGKTELLNSLRELSEWALLVSNLTPAAMISGYVDQSEDDHSLLPQLDGKTLVMKDFTTVLAMNPAQRDEIYGILRDCYDGHAAKNFGTGRREYKSRFNVLAGVTNAIEGAWHLSALGERFLCWSMTTDHKEQAKRALLHANNESTMRQELADAAAGVLAGLPDVVPGIPEPLKHKTLTLAFLLARLRTYVARDRNDVVHRAPEVEVPTRLVKQLLRLGQSVALVRHKEQLTDGEFSIMRKVALDSVPSARLSIFNELLSAKKGGGVLKKPDSMYAIDYFARRCRISHSPAKRHLDDMVLLGLAQAERKNRADFYRLTTDVWNEWREIQS